MSNTTEWCPVCGHRLGHAPGASNFEACPECEECHEEPASWPGSDTEPSDPWQTSGPR